MSDSKLQQFFESFTQKFFEPLMGIEPHEQCYQKHNSNPDRFVDCMLDKTNKLEKISKTAEVRLLYTTLRLQKCLQGSDEKTCFEEANKNGERFLADLKQSIEKL